MKKLFIVTALSMLTMGCAGLSPDHKAEQEALENLHKAEAKVERKEIKLTLATAASAAAMANVLDSTKELSEAKKEAKVAKEEFDQVMGTVEK